MDFNGRFDRRSVLTSSAELQFWPSVDVSALSLKERIEFEGWCAAVTKFVCHPEVSVDCILGESRLGKATLYRIVKRCFEKHDDGRIFGFRALLKYTRVHPHERNAPVLPKGKGSRGTSGAFEMLLRTYPDIQKSILTSIKKRCRQIDDPSEVRRPIQLMHADFLKACRSAGVKANNYPFNTDYLALRSFQSFVKRIAEKEFNMAVLHRGSICKTHAAGVSGQAAASSRPFEVVEFDGHKIDLRLTIRLLDPLGFETVVELHRIWILVIIDVFSRAVLGYCLALGREYNKDDIANCLQSALKPESRRTFAIPNLSPREGAGLPGVVYPEVCFACWDWFRMDGAKSHFAENTLLRLNQVVGCWTDNGAPAEPNSRPFIERFFALIAKHFAHRLPGTLGSDPTAIERILGDPNGDLELLVELSELEDMIDVLIANYNVEVHEGLARSPLETIRYFLDRGQMVRRLPEQLRQSLCLLQEAKIVPVHGSVERGVRPHVNFLYVKYTSPLLSSSAGLIGRSLRIYYDVRDIRTVRAFFENGEELGILTAARPWNQTPHTVSMRQEIYRLIKLKRIIVPLDGDPVQEWVKFKQDAAKKSKPAANALAKAKAAGVPMGPATPAIHSPPDVVDEGTQSGSEKGTDNVVPLTPKTMQIRKTFTY